MLLLIDRMVEILPGNGESGPGEGRIFMIGFCPRSGEVNGASGSGYQVRVHLRFPSRYSEGAAELYFFNPYIKPVQCQVQQAQVEIDKPCLPSFQDFP